MKKILTALLLSCIAYTGSAQYIDANSTKPKSSFTDRLFFGGTLGLQFATDQTYIEVAPLVGYRVTEKFSAGLNLKYIFYKAHIDNFPSYTTSLYGGGPFARYFIFEGLFAHLEYELLNMEVPDLYGNLYRENVSSVFVGGGYRQMLGERSALDFMILWNINDYKYSPYVNPIIQFGFAFGI